MSTWSGATPRPSMARRAASRWASDMPSSSHSSWRGVAHGPRLAPVGDAVEQRLALALGELLGVADLVDPAVRGHHDGADRERAGPRPPADLVDADHHLVPGVPQLPLDREARALPLERGPQRRRGPRCRWPAAGGVRRHAEDRTATVGAWCSASSPDPSARSRRRPARRTPSSARPPTSSTRWTRCTNAPTRRRTPR